MVASVEAVTAEGRVANHLRLRACGAKGAFVFVVLATVLLMGSGVSDQECSSQIKASLTCEPFKDAQQISRIASLMAKKLAQLDKEEMSSGLPVFDARHPYAQLALCQRPPYPEVPVTTVVVNGGRLSPNPFFPAATTPTEFNASFYDGQAVAAMHDDVTVAPRPPSMVGAGGGAPPFTFPTLESYCGFVTACSLNSTTNRPHPEMYTRPSLSPMVYLKKPLPHFRVVLGIPAVDGEKSAIRRGHVRSTWMQYRQNYDSSKYRRSPRWGANLTEAQRAVPPIGTAKEALLLVRFIFARHHKHGYSYSDALMEEMRENTDVLLLEMNEGKSTTNKEASGFGYWGVEAEIGMSRKTLFWHALAPKLYSFDFVAKGDDDVYLRLPQYFSDLSRKILPILAIYSTTFNTARVGGGAVYDNKKDLFSKYGEEIDPFAGNITIANSNCSDCNTANFRPWPLSVKDSGANISVDTFGIEPLRSFVWGASWVINYEHRASYRRIYDTPSGSSRFFYAVGYLVTMSRDLSAIVASDHDIYQFTSPHIKIRNDFAKNESHGHAAIRQAFRISRMIAAGKGTAAYSKNSSSFPAGSLIYDLGMESLVSDESRAVPLVMGDFLSLALRHAFVNSIAPVHYTHGAEALVHYGIGAASSNDDVYKDNFLQYEDCLIGTIIHRMAAKRVNALKMPLPDDFNHDDADAVREEDVPVTFAQEMLMRAGRTLGFSSLPEIADERRLEAARLRHIRIVERLMRPNLTDPSIVNVSTQFAVKKKFFGRSATRPDTIRRGLGVIALHDSRMSYVSGKAEWHHTLRHKVSPADYYSDYRAFGGYDEEYYAGNTTRSPNAVLDLGPLDNGTAPRRFCACYNSRARDVGGWVHNSRHAAPHLVI